MVTFINTMRKIELSISNVKYVTAVVVIYFAFLFSIGGKNKCRDFEVTATSFDVGYLTRTDV